MEIKTTSSRMHSLIVLYDMHTKFFLKALEGISDKDAHNRLNTKANHIAWLAGSLVQERYQLASEFGSDLKQGAYELFRDHRGIQDNVTYPPLADLKKDWEAISPLLRNSLVNVPDSKLDSEFKIPQMSMPYFDLIAFMTYREANCIGQIILWRRLLSYEGIKYD
jgi:hypothetical protein